MRSHLDSAFCPSSPLAPAWHHHEASSMIILMKSLSLCYKPTQSNPQTREFSALRLPSRLAMSGNDSFPHTSIHPFTTHRRPEERERKPRNYFSRQNSTMTSPPPLPSCSHPIPCIPKIGTEAERSGNGLGGESSGKVTCWLSGVHLSRSVRRWIRWGEEDCVLTWRAV